MAYRSSRSQIKGIVAVGASFIAVILAAAFIFDTFFGGKKEMIGECEFHFIDVGQGDCTMIITDDSTVVVDAGPNDCADETLKYINSYTDKIDYLVLTHPHEDHIGGADEILESIKVTNVIMSDASSETQAFSRLLDAIEDSEATLIEGKAGQSYEAGKIEFSILSPLSEFRDMNDYSLVLRVSFGETAAIITGDAEKNSEDLIVEKYPESELFANILRLAHHGSNTSNTEEFMNVVGPEYAVISCGENNSYGHPHIEVLQKLWDEDITYYRTDEHSHIVFASDGYTVQCVNQ